MFDLSDIGKAGLIIQYEDIISMIGYNIAKFFHKKGIYNKLDNTSIKDVLLSYINREDENCFVWLNKEYEIKIHPSDVITSFLTMQPNLMYSYRVFRSAHLENLNSLYIYSDIHSSIIEQSTKSYGFKGVEYLNSDIIEFLNHHPNCTYLTSSINNIKRCVDELNAPTCLVICDDYLYISEIFESKIDQKLKDKDNIALRFTSVISAGII